MPRQSERKRKHPSGNTSQEQLPTPRSSPRGQTSAQNLNGPSSEHNSSYSRPTKKIRSQYHHTPSAKTKVDQSDTERSVSIDYAARPTNRGSLKRAIEGQEQENELSYDYGHTPVLPSSENSANSLIRILILHGGPPESPLSCSIKTLNLDSHAQDKSKKQGKRCDHEDYEALSYVWGEQSGSKAMQKLKIHIDDQNVSILEITPSLTMALKRLRWPATNKNRRLWVDAVCINQKSDAEKNSQVPLMAKIYSNASNVCVWVGDELKEKKTMLAVNLVSSIRLLRNYDTFVEHHSQCSEWDALLDLMKREWFSRRWVVQEIAMAQKATIYCGQQQLDWYEFSEAVSLFQEMEERVRQKFKESKAHNHPADYFGHLKAFSACRLVARVNQLVQKTEDGRIVRRTANLEELVSTLTSFRGSVSHDTIYAVLALANDVSGSDAFPKSQPPIRMDPTTMAKWQREHPNVNPQTIIRALQGFRVEKYPVDYKKDFVEVARDFLEIVTGRSGSLDMILRPWVDDKIPKQILDSLPSWIRTLRYLPHKPDWKGHYQRVNANPLVGAPGKQAYSAAGTYPGHWSFGKNPNCWTLTANGFIFDHVGEVEESALGATIPESWYKFGHWEDRDEIPPQHFWRTIVADRDAQGEKCAPWYAQACRISFGETIEGSDAQTSIMKENIGSQVVKDFLERVQAVTWGKRLLRTKEKGCLGLGPNKPQTVQPGDAICILFGCSVPVILREHNTSDNLRYYELIGECYIHGMMNGDALKERNDPRRGISNEDFVIR